MSLSICLSGLWSKDDWIVLFDTGTLPVFAHDFLSPTGFKRMGRPHVIANLCLPPPPTTRGFHTKPPILCVCQWCDLLMHHRRHVRLYHWDVLVWATETSEAESKWCNDELSLMMWQYINREYLTAYYWDLMTHNGFERQYNHWTNVAVIANRQSSGSHMSRRSGLMFWSQIALLNPNHKIQKWQKRGNVFPIIQPRSMVSLPTRALNRFKERKRKPETNEILTGTEPETKSNFIVPNRIKKLKWLLTC